MINVNMKTIIGLTAGITLFHSHGFSELKAFPTAEGYGRLAKGGRGGRVIEVTNLNDVGCIVPMLDDHDRRIIEETRKGTTTYKGSRTGFPGLIDNEKDCGGLEEYPVEKRVADWDSDHDGMPDTWEIAHGLNPKNADDRNNMNLSADGYTNLEMYLNELAGDPVQWDATALRSLKAAVRGRCFSITPRGLTFSLPVGSRVRVERIDMSGKVVDVFHDGALTQEKQPLPFKRCGGQPTGVQLLRVTAEGKSATASVVTIR